MVLVAILAMICGFLANHLGLTEAVSSVIAKISKCPKCTTFWFTFLTLMICNYNPIIALSLSLFSSYMSFWLGLLFIWLNKKYNKIWEKIQN